VEKAPNWRFQQTQEVVANIEFDNELGRNFFIYCQSA
jgi:hypothetical protein